MPTHPDSIAFLGIAERAAYVRHGNTSVFKWNVIGLRTVVFSTIFPLNLAGWHLGLAMRSGTLKTGAELRVVGEDGAEAGSISLQASVVRVDSADPAIRSEGPLLLDAGDDWTVFFVPVGSTSGFTIQRPGLYAIEQKMPEGTALQLGHLHFALVEAPVLSPERVAAIRADPNAVKAVRATLGCIHCPTKLNVYAALERDPKQEANGYQWYRDIPGEFRCECGRTVIDLGAIRTNLHAPIGDVAQGDEEISYVPLYERSGLEGLLQEFRRLLEKDPPEETLQVFIQDNPVLLHQFPAVKLFFKPPLLTFFKADFAVVSPQKELILIEIETAHTRLLRKDGGEAAELRHAIDQVLSWLHVADEHRLAVLNALGLPRDAVGAIRGVVIAGRDRGHDAEHLRRLKGVDRGRVSFLTFDDLAFSVTTLIRRMQRL